MSEEIERLQKKIAECNEQIDIARNRAAEYGSRVKRIGDKNDQFADDALRYVDRYERELAAHYERLRQLEESQTAKTAPKASTGSTGCLVLVASFSGLCLLLATVVMAIR